MRSTECPSSSSLNTYATVTDSYKMYDCLSVVSFNSTISQLTSVSDLPMHTNKFCSVLFDIPVHWWKRTMLTVINILLPRQLVYNITWLAKIYWCIAFQHDHLRPRIGVSMYATVEICWWYFTLYQSSIQNRDTGQKSRFSPQLGVPVKVMPQGLVWNTRMAWLHDGEKSLRICLLVLI